MVTVESKFIGIFKTGDNIVHNLEVLALLYGYYNAAQPEQRRLLCKPIIILLVAIIDAVLHDLHQRIREFRTEGVRNVLEESRNYIRSRKKMEKLEATIESAKKQGLIEPANDAFYTRLDELRKLRNRVHIQNIKKYSPPNESEAFSEAMKTQAEQCVEKTLKVMARKYSRDHDYVAAFNLPWNAHYPA
ncbi:hypothetical protein [Pseudorhodoplanes sp.]|uniref:hypothetical protein n=1 Tax=Pseudorhodoplanes sp. TaxID=1934341 RepID=UPI002D1B606A|nr:hypothetical protein [Pseudorhodoplanes sp.]HWV51725.1 hypothetical protein [Pseudorhodoplanes sp.]